MGKQFVVFQVESMMCTGGFLVQEFFDAYYASSRNANFANAHEVLFDEASSYIVSVILSDWNIDYDADMLSAI